jgi:hypothetical protein
MDPILVAAIREFLKRHAVLAESGVEVTPEQIEEFFRAKTEGRFGMAEAQELIAGIDTDINPRNVARSVTQGVTFNFGDELLGLFSKNAKERMRLREDLYSEEHPWADALGQIGGGLLVPGAAVAGAVKKGRALHRVIGTGAALGGASGALAGAGAGETGEERADNALIGGGVGTVLGGAVPSLVASVRALSPVSRANRRVGNAINKSGGVEALRAQNQAAVTAGRGSEVMLGDLSPHLRRATDFATNANDDALVDVASKVRERQAGMSERMLEDVRSEVGDVNAPERLTGLKDARNEWADAAYGALRKQHPELPDPHGFAEVLNRPKIRDAWKTAQETGFIGEFPDVGNPSFDRVQSLLERLGGMRDRAFRSGDNDLGFKLDEAFKELRGELEKRVPGYREVTAEYARRMDLERALEAGQAAWNQTDKGGLRQMVRALSPDELAEFRRGMASELIAKLRSAQTNRNVAKELMEASQSMQEKLEIVFGSKEAFERFMSRIAQEGEMAKLSGTIGGSETARRLTAQGFDPLELGMAGLMGGAGGFSSSLASLLTKFGRGAVARRTAGEMGPVLSTQGSDNIDNLLQAWGARPPMAGRFAGAALPVAAPNGLLDQ